MKIPNKYVLALNPIVALKFRASCNMKYALFMVGSFHFSFFGQL